MKWKTLIFVITFWWKKSIHSWILIHAYFEDNDSDNDDEEIKAGEEVPHVSVSSESVNEIAPQLKDSWVECLMMLLGELMMHLTMSVDHLGR